MSDTRQQLNYRKWTAALVTNKKKLRKMRMDRFMVENTES